MTRLLNPHRLLTTAWCLCMPAMLSAEMPSAERFAELLTVARSHVGTAVLVDAEEMTLRNRDALNFLFRTEDGALISVALDIDSSDVLSASGRAAATAPKPKRFIDRVADFLNGTPSPSTQASDGTGSDGQADQSDDTDRSDPDRGDDDGRDRGGDRGGDQGDGQGNGNGSGNGRR